MTASMFLHTHSKSVGGLHDVAEPMPLMMHCSEHDGKREMSWAETAVARAMRAVVYFILAVIVLVVWGWWKGLKTTNECVWLVWLVTERV